MVNQNQIKYWLKADKKFLLKLLKGKTDDFDWKVYHYQYEEELKEMAKNYTQIIKSKDYIFDDGKLYLKNDKIKPLFPRHELLLETILQFNPLSVLEIGSGWGDHLHNLSILNSNLELFGFDISIKQIENLQKRHPDLKLYLEIKDITIETDFLPKCDIVYTNAVLMHTKDHGKYLKALQNIFKIANNQVIFNENWKSHNFLDDIKKLFSDNKITWPEIFYYVKSTTKDGSRVMIISSKKLDLISLSDNSQLLEEFISTK